MSRATPLLVATLLTAASIAAAQPPGPPPGTPQGPPRGQGMPPRDRATAQLGTSVIRGRVLGADNGRPLRRARITATAPELGGEPRTASTGNGMRSPTFPPHATRSVSSAVDTFR